MRHPKHSLTIGIITLAALSVASCTQDIVPADDADTRPALLQLHSLQASGISGTSTRTVTTTDYPTDRLIGFFVKEDIPNKYASCNNNKGTYDASVSEWLPTPEILLNKNDADIAVYAPYDLTQTAPAALELTACLRPSDGSRDIWCKRFTANNRNADITALTLEHVYTRLSLSVSRSADYKEEITLTDISLTGNEIYAGSTYRFFKDVPYAYDGTKGFGASSVKVLNDTSPTATYDLLLIPTAMLTEDITLAFTVNGKKMRVGITKDRFAATGGKLEAGKQYNINLTLTPDKLEIVSVAIVKWNTPAEVNGGEADYAPPADIIKPDGIESPDYTPGDNIQNNDPKPM